MAGQPPILSVELIEKFRRLLPTVLYLETVADFLGVHRTTWRMWLRRGAKEDRRLSRPRAKPKASEALYLEFFYTHKSAVAKGEIGNARTVRAAAKKQWQAAAWLLERRFPDRWGRDTQQIADLKALLRELEKRSGVAAAQKAPGKGQAPA